MHRIIFAFFFLSGFSSLVFEVLWARMLMKVFGTTSFTISTLLTAFMAGLALGSFVGGRVAHKIKSPLLLYGIMEGAIGVYALCVPFFLSMLPSIYSLFFDSFLDNFYVFSLLRFVVVFLILIVPTTLMGATLPIVSHWLSQYAKKLSGSIGLLYGANTLGACAGCFLAGFILLPTFGLSLTNIIFAIINFLLAAVVFIFIRITRHSLAFRETGQDVSSPETIDDLDSLVGINIPVQPIPRWMIRLVYLSFAFTGLLAMSYQVMWTRAYVIVLGSSTYSFTLVLTGILIGTALGSATLSLYVERFARPIYWFAIAQTGVTLSATMGFYLLDKLPVWLFYRMRDTISSASEIYIYYFLLIGLLVFIPSFLQGISFTLVVRSLVHQSKRVGASVGKLYTFNSTGSIFGSFAAGFILMPVLGLYKSMLVLIVVNLVVALLLAVVELTQYYSTPRVALAGCAVIIALTTLLIAPPIDHARLTSGMFRSFWARELYTPESFERSRPTILYYHDGLNATTSVEQRGRFRTLKANGKPEASDGADMATQIMVGLLPFVIRSGNPNIPVGNEVSAMIGYGSGVTSGASLQWPLASLEVVEIERSMTEASRFFDHINHQPLDDIRTRFIESDGRNYLQYTSTMYDVIVSEPSNPWIAGVSSLFTVEHFQQISRHLNPGGVFAQWVQLYELSPTSVRRILATFLDVFPYVHAFSSMPKSTDIILIGSNDPIQLPPQGYTRAWALESTRAELERAGIDHIHDIYGLLFMSQQEMEAFADGATLNTDDNGILEFQAPKDLILYWIGERYFAEKYFRSGTYGDPRPYLNHWPQASHWDANDIGALARAQWLAGKSPLARSILEDTEYASIESLELPFAPDLQGLSPLEEIHLVLHAESLSRGDALIHAWPFKNSALYPTLIKSIETEQHAQALVWMERQQAPDDDGYSGEQGLFYAYLLAERRYFRPALRQLDRLRQENDSEITNSLPFLLIDAYILQRRSRLKDSYEQYLKAGHSLAQ